MTPPTAAEVEAVRAGCLAIERRCTLGNYAPGQQCGKILGQLCPNATVILTALRHMDAARISAVPQNEIEAVARAIAVKDGAEPDRQYVMPAKLGWQMYDDMATAAIIALDDARAAAGMVVVPKEPTEAMKWAHEMPDIGPDEIAAMWRAMIAKVAV